MSVTRIYRTVYYSGIPELLSHYFKNNVWVKGFGFGFRVHSVGLGFSIDRVDLGFSVPG